jgi:hypothetical protein
LQHFLELRLEGPEKEGRQPRILFECATGLTIRRLTEDLFQRGAAHDLPDLGQIF